MSYLSEEIRVTKIASPSIAAENLFLEYSKQSPLPRSKGFLLTMGNYLGTLAAARDLGSHGIPVVLADCQKNSLTAASAYISRFERSPNLDSLDIFAQWLTKFGQKNPGYVLYPTCDEMCLLISRHHQTLSRYYYLCRGSTTSSYQLLNKEILSQLCQSLEINYPQTWFPQSELEQLALADTVQYPVVVKPKTQGSLSKAMKGEICYSKEQFLNVLSKFSNSTFYKAEALQYDPSLGTLIVQKFHPEAAENIYSLAGFFDGEKDVYVLRASEKVLQQPVKIGVGLCFESREIYAEPANQLRRLLEKVSYRGAFEVEFIHRKEEDSFLLIDFNPRFYGQMGFEIARNLPIARLCYFSAIGDHEKTQELAKASLDWDHNNLCKYCPSSMLKFFVTTQWLGGSMSKDRKQFWLDWEKTGQRYDSIYSPEDSRPSWAYVWQCWQEFLRYPGSNYRKYFRA